VRVEQCFGTLEEKQPDQIGRVFGLGFRKAELTRQ